MKRIIFLVATFTSSVLNQPFPMLRPSYKYSRRNIRSAKPSQKTTVPSIAISKSTIDLNGTLTKMKMYYMREDLYIIQEELKQAWAEIMNGERGHSPRIMDDLKKFLKQVIENYNFDIMLNTYKNVDNAWNNYLIVFGKEYIAEEKEKRKAIFQKNLERIEKHNRLFEDGKVTYTMKFGPLSDRTREEMAKMKGFRPPQGTSNKHPSMILRQNDTRKYHYTRGAAVPAAGDWRVNGDITPVKFQGDCSSSYAFAALGALEAYHKRKTGELVSLSVQNILDCTWNLGNTGCDGGFIHSVFEYARTHGVESEDQYPYTMNASHRCNWKKQYVVATDEAHYWVERKEVETQTGNEVALQHAVASHGPVAIGIGTPEDFENYGSGVFQSANCGPANHAVLVVGYGTDPVHGDYWAIKNSYGEFWGDDGYFGIARNKNSMCNVAQYAFFPD